MRFFLDTEFSERGPRYPIELISVALVAESGREFYAISSEFDANACNPWVKENVLPHLARGVRHPLWEIRAAVQYFVGQCCVEPFHGGIHTSPTEFWGYYADYDWVVFCQIFGTMIDLPTGWPMYCRDLKQWSDALGNPTLPKQSSTEHNALNDARWNRLVHEFLSEVELGRDLRILAE